MAHEGTCPNCGHCDKCGRSNFKPWIYPYWSVLPPQYTSWAPQYTTSSGSNTQITGTSFC